MRQWEGRLPVLFTGWRATHESFLFNYLSLTISAATATQFHHHFPALPGMPSPIGLKSGVSLWLIMLIGCLHLVLAHGHFLTQCNANAHRGSFTSLQFILYLVHRIYRSRGKMKCSGPFMKMLCMWLPHAPHVAIISFSHHITQNNIPWFLANPVLNCMRLSWADF